MFSLQDQLPRYLLGKYQLTMTVVSTALFTLVFLLVISPYSSNSWLTVGSGPVFLLSLAFTFVALITIVFSKRCLYQLRNAKDFTILSFALWTIAEILIISLIYTAFTIEGNLYNVLFLGDMSFDEVFWHALAYSAVSIGVPCVVCSLYYALEDKDNTIRLMNYSNVVSDVPLTPSEEKRITLFDNNGVLKLSVNLENLFFIESDDNYIKVWYSDNSGDMKQYMLRCRLKTVEDSFADSNLIRCHRKFIVNIGKIKILKAEKDGYQVDLGIDHFAPIPISKTYEKTVLARFNNS